MNISMLDKSHVHMKYELNETYFDCIDTENKAYILGLLYADGNVGKETNIIQISLQESDKSILEKMQKEIGSTHPLKMIPYNSKNPNWKNQFCLSISNKYMHDSLVKQGLVPNKSLILKYPNFLENNLQRHFIRGYMDGDGSISQNPKDKRASLVGANDFCLSIRQI